MLSLLLLACGGGALDTAAALMGVRSIGGGFSFTDNSALPTSDVEALLAAIGEENIGGSVTIEGNGEG